MKKTKAGWSGLFILATGFVMAGCAGKVDQLSAQGQASDVSALSPGDTGFKLDDALLRWPLPAGEQAYAAIDGKHMHQYVVEQSAIARKYRDNGHPKFWG